ncbi:YcjF family protein [Limoniibacter endophyticus]|uniref:UPF0283 membrane protein n=1 Tax=Limoniibacter endophyticus TaxID=1565040 RepID=A0A8J3DNF3_9HYPH|nr:TIGR01620 family protein [Limoniibacter endophyticus]GHC60505.1 UPF0283 membrane protein [Limoniibacter endophyticus]
MSEPRKPAAFKVEPKEAEKPAAGAVTRLPRAIDPGEAVAIEFAPDTAYEEDDQRREAPAAAALPGKKRSLAARFFFGATGILVSLAFATWLDGFIRNLFARSDWLGWLAATAAAVFLVSLLVIAFRELRAVARLASVADLQKLSIEAIDEKNDAKAEKATRQLLAFTAPIPETAAGRKTIGELDGEIIDGRQLLDLAEKQILSPLDRIANRMVLDSAKRVAVVTAVSPRALVDLGYVAYESLRLIRRIATLYGAKPSLLGIGRLLRAVVSHLAITGTIAIGDGIVQQVIGQGLAARLSARFGEGVVNGLMTARIGIAAIETVRPLPFNAIQRPRLKDFLSPLSVFASAKQREQDAKSSERLID